ncbi:hypothetical protein [Streptomyces noursei]
MTKEGRSEDGTSEGEGTVPRTIEDLIAMADRLREAIDKHVLVLGDKQQ